MEDARLIALDDIVVAPDNPRTHLDGIEELAASLTGLGQLVPVIVERRAKDGKYDLLAGHRRCAALRHLGRTEVRAQIRAGRRLDKASRLALMLAENAQRRPLDPIDEATAYRALIDERGITHLEVAKIVGTSDFTVSRRLELLRLSPADQDRVRTGAVTVTGAHALLNPNAKKRAPRGRYANSANVDPDSPNTITFAITDKERAELTRRCKARNITPEAFARAALRQVLR